MTKVAVIGSGIGGLSAAAVLASRGVDVTIFEAMDRPGGKAGLAKVDGVEFDTGPSVLTLPEVFEDIFSYIREPFRDQVSLRRLSPAFRYLYDDGTSLDVHHSAEATLESVAATLGAKARDELAGFLSYARGIWEAAAPNFVYGPAPTWSQMVGLGLTQLGAIRRIDSTRSMWRAIEEQVKEPHLRYLLARYATYNGSNVFAAPATLNCIAHVELVLGGYGVEGGMYSIVRAFLRALDAWSVEIKCKRRVVRLLLDGSTVKGVVTEEGKERRFDAVVANADASHVRELLGRKYRRAVRTSDQPSMSGWTAVIRARRASEPRVGHTVLFPKRYEREFEDIFEHERAPEDPTIYVCAQSECHGRSGWPDAEPLFVMVNAPPEPKTGSSEDAVWKRVEAHVLDRLRQRGLIHPSDSIVWDRTPKELAALFGGSRGSIYGASSNSALAAFRRPPNRIRKIGGLYLASGSAHPGGGVPLCALSGKAAAMALLEDLGLDETGDIRRR